MSAGITQIEGSAVLIASAIGGLKEARRKYPDKGNCAIRAVLDVEISDLSRSLAHLRAAAQTERQR